MSNSGSAVLLALVLGGVLSAASSGCSSVANTASSGDDPVDDVTSALTTFTCGSCPGGTFATRLTCDTFNCGNTCTSGFSTNASFCTTAPSCGSFTKCGTSCPSGFATSSLSCDTFNCGNTCTPGFSQNAATCTSISQPTCCNTCSPFPVGGTNDRGSLNGQHFVELFFTSFTSSNPSIGTATVASCTCGVSFTVGQIFCDGAATSVGVSFASSTQVNIVIPPSPVTRSCVAYSSSTNTQFVQFNFTVPPN